MDEDLKRVHQVSIRLNDIEVDQLADLIGYRGLYEKGDLFRAGLQMLIEAEQRDHHVNGTTGARSRRKPAKKVRKP